MEQISDNVSVTPLPPVPFCPHIESKESISDINTKYFASNTVKGELKTTVGYCATTVKNSRCLLNFQIVLHHD